VRAQAQLEELKIGPRQEQIAQAQAQLAALRAQSAEARPTTVGCSRWHASA
jgi:HlyD family secretion protein